MLILLISIVSDEARCKIKISPHDMKEILLDVAFKETNNTRVIQSADDESVINF